MTYSFRQNFKILKTVDQIYIHLIAPLNCRNNLNTTRLRLYGHGNLFISLKNFLPLKMIHCNETRVWLNKQRAVELFIFECFIALFTQGIYLSGLQFTTANFSFLIETPRIKFVHILSYYCTIMAKKMNMLLIQCVFFIIL